MDLGTIIGLIAAIGLFAWSMISGSGGEVMDTFFDAPSAILVVGGSAFITLLSCRLDRFLALAKITKNAFFNRSTKPTELITQLVSLSDVARREGILSLQNTIAEMKDPFLSNGLQMVVDGTDAETIKQVLDLEVEALEQRHGEGKGVLDLGGKYAPAFGMMGTLVGLVIMLKNMEDPSKIGAGMAVALLTTLYGAVIANVFCLPLADKLTAKHDEEMLALEIAKAGILGLQAGDNPRILEMKLAVFLSPKQRALLAQAEKA
ncbi:MAG: MotA/TolQ/ExbB proton channel family protein [Planctomycetota bacterium]